MSSYERIIAVVFALGLLLAGALGADAQNYEAALAGFTKDSFNDSDSASGAVAASGNPLAIQVIEALQDGRLSFSGDKVFIKDKAGATLDAATGKPAVAPADAATVRLNNRLRRSVEAALGGLTLMSSDPGKRYEAAQAVFKSRDANAFATLNAAHGEMVMLGAYVTFMVQEIIRARYPGLFDASLFIAVPLAFLFAGSVGILIERCVIRFLYGRPLETLLATWGVSLILQQAVRTGFGPTNKEVGNPSWMSGAFELGGITITYNRMWIIVFTLAVFVALLALLRFTRLGLEMRAVTQNRSMAASMGIRTARIDALTFGLGSGIAGIAGVALSQIDNVSPNLGQGYIIDSFLVVVFGGVGNLWGTLVGAFSLGIANKFLEPYAGAVLGKIAILVFIILFIQKRPRGLFALKGRAVEA